MPKILPLLFIRCTEEFAARLKEVGIEGILAVEESRPVKAFSPAAHPVP